jgi:uncharacterized membrane protein (Fun14 family)
MIDTTTITSSSGLVNSGMPLIAGGVFGFLICIAIKKILKIAAFVLGLILALIMFLEYKHWISVNWSTIQSQTSEMVQRSAQQMLNAVNNTAGEMSHHSLNHMDVGFPLLGITGFVPGLVLGLAKG